MKLWGGRFTKEINQLVYNFNASITYDQKFYKQDILGSIAHVTMLAKQGILTDDERQQIVDGLQGILKDIENGTLEITMEHEDIHTFVEANLIERIGDAGKKLHTGRSRNDQVALDMKLYIRDEIVAINDLLKAPDGSDPPHHERKYRYFHAWFHSPAESPAGYAGSPLWCLL